MLRIAILLIMVALSIAFPLLASAESPPTEIKEYSGEISAVAKERTVIYESIGGRDVAFPQSVVIQWQASLKYELEESSADYRYRVDSVRAYFPRKPPDRVTKGGIEAVITWYTSVNIDIGVELTTVPFQGIRPVTTITYNIFVSAHISFSKLSVGTIDIIREVEERVGQLVFAVDANISRYEPEPKIFITHLNVSLTGDGTINIYRFGVSGTSVEVVGYVGAGDLEKDGYLMILPKANIGVGLCLEGPEGTSSLVLSGELRYVDPLGNTHTAVATLSVGCTNASLNEVPVIPGVYNGSNALVLQFISTGFSTAIRINTSVIGSSLWVGRPFVALVDNGTGYLGVLTVGVRLQSYGVSGVGYVNLTAQDLGIVCGGEVDNGTSYIECTKPVPNYNGNTTRVYVTAYLAGTSVSGVVEVPVARIGNTPYARVISGFVTALSSAGLLLFLAGATLMLVTSLASAFFHKTINLPVDPWRLMGTGLVLVIVMVIIPMIAGSVLSVLMRYLPTRAAIVSGPITDPAELMSKPPNEVVSTLIYYYDLLFVTMKADFTKWVSAPMATDVTIRLVGVGIMIGALIVLSLVLMSSMNAALAGQVLVPLISFVFSILAVLVSMAPLLGAFSAFMNIVQGLMIISLVVVGVLIITATFLMLAPSPAMVATAEDMLAGVIGFMIVVPVMGPLSYAFYVVVRDTVEKLLAPLTAISTAKIATFSVAGPVASLIPPIDVVTRVIAYITFSSATLLLVALSFIGPLMLAGLFSGISFAILRAFRLR